jgi:hypothetical protein
MFLFGKNTMQSDGITSVEYRLVPEDDRYRVGDDGSVWSRAMQNGRPGYAATWRRLSARVMASGHLMVGFGDRKRLVHRLVLQSFVGPCPEGMECRHLDGNPANNVPSNLAWGTKKENREDASRHGALATGTRNGRGKLTTEDVRRMLSMKGTMTQRKIAVEFGVGAPHVCAIFSGRKRSRDQH